MSDKTFFQVVYDCGCKSKGAQNYQDKFVNIGSGYCRKHKEPAVSVLMSFLPENAFDDPKANKPMEAAKK